MLGLSLAIISCAEGQKTANKEEANTPGQPVAEQPVAQETTILKVLSNDEFVSMQEETTDLQIVDVRTPREVAQGVIPGAIHINIQDADFVERMEQLDKSKPVVVYCAAGGRSARASQQLEDKGFTAIYDLTGGFSKWSSEGRPIQKD